MNTLCRYSALHIKWKNNEVSERSEESMVIHFSSNRKIEFWNNSKQASFKFNTSDGEELSPISTDIMDTSSFQ